jgi:hypothetical protein
LGSSFFCCVVEFKFTEAQRELAVREGIRRQSYNEKKGLRGRGGAPHRGRAAKDLHLIGAAAEVAVAVYLEAEKYLFLDEAPVRGSCDLPGLDIKCRSRHYYDLLVQLDDNLDKTFVLVTIESGITYMHGFIHGLEVPTLGTIREFVPGRRSYAIPQSELKPMEMLKDSYDADKMAREPIETMWK